MRLRINSRYGNSGRRGKLWWDEAEIKTIPCCQSCPLQAVKRCIQPTLKYCSCSLPDTNALFNFTLTLSGRKCVRLYYEAITQPHVGLKISCLAVRRRLAKARLQIPLAYLQQQIFTISGTSGKLNTFISGLSRGKCDPHAPIALRPAGNPKPITPYYELWSGRESDPILHLKRMQ